MYVVHELVINALTSKERDEMAQRMDGIRIREDGRLEKRISVNGKRQSVYGYTLKEVTEKANKLLLEGSRQALHQSVQVTFDEYFDEYLNSRECLGIKGNTLKAYRSGYRKHLSPLIGNCRIRELSIGRVKEIQKVLEETLSPGSVRNLMSLIKRIMKEAVRDGIIEYSPIEELRVKTGYVKDSGKHRALTDEEQRLFMKEAKSSAYKHIYSMMLYTGMRCGEVTALRWGDIDEHRGVIRVSRTITYNKDGTTTIGPTKSLNSRREIPITLSVRKVIASCRRELENVVPIKNMLLFAAFGGGVIRSDLLNTDIERILAKLEKKGTPIAPFTTHAFRHTFASDFIASGGTPQTLKAILGHATLAMTMDTYVTTSEQGKRDEMMRLKITV